MNEYKVTINLLGHVYKTTIKAPDKISARQRVVMALVDKINAGLTIEQVDDDLSFLKSIFNIK